MTTETKREAWMPCDTELTARRMLVEYREANWTPEVAALTRVFIAMWSTSLTVENLEQLAVAMTGFPVDLKTTLAQMVRAKVLRSRATRGRRLYEINY